MNPTEYVADIDKRLQSLGNKVEDFIKETVTASKDITTEKLEHFYDKLLTHLNKEKYLTDEDVKKIKADPNHDNNIVETVQLMGMTTPNLTNLEKICYKAANFCKKIGFSSLSIYLIDKITLGKLEKIYKMESAVTESIKFKETLLKPIAKSPIAKPKKPKAELGRS